MTRIVVDASVAIKWFLPEQESDSADRVLASAGPMHAPDLLLLETASVLWKKVRSRHLGRSEATTIRQGLDSVPLILHPAGPLLETALELALDAGRSIYDSLYLALAFALDCPFVTADEKLVNAIRQYSTELKIIHLPDWKE